MRFAIIVLWLAGAAALAQPPEEKDDLPWVCVPTEDRQWRCGRGAGAPEPRPLPPSTPPRAAPEGYQPPADGSRLTDHLREPGQPASPGQETASTPASEDQETPPAGNGPPAGDGEAVEPAAEPDPEGSRDASPAPARYGIQLVAGRDLESVEAYRGRTRLQSLDVYRRTWEDAGGVWHVLLAGRFETVAAARRALEELPADIRRAGAWVRPLDELDIPSDQSRDTKSD